MTTLAGLVTVALVCLALASVVVADAWDETDEGDGDE